MRLWGVDVHEAVLAASTSVDVSGGPAPTIVRATAYSAFQA